jgi:agmatinase
MGVAAALTRVPRAPRYFLSLDIGALDPSIAPGLELPMFGGLDYYQATNLIKGLVGLGDVVGMALTGIVPDRDLHDMTSLLGVRLILNLLGALAHSGRRIGVGEGEAKVTPALVNDSHRLPAAARG